MAYCKATKKSRCYMMGTIIGQLHVLECCGCNLQGDIIEKARPEYKKVCISLGQPEPEFEPMCRSLHFLQRSEAIKHLRLHRCAGDKVPRKAFRRLRRELRKYGDQYSCDPAYTEIKNPRAGYVGVELPWNEV